jgi:predicted MPP superfamily phosphohydrolase
MTTSFFAVFTPSLVMTAVVGVFMTLCWRAARNPYALASYWACALLVHLGWLAIPHLGGLASIARWLASMWLGGMLVAMVLMIPFALLSVVSNLPKLESLSTCLPAVYAACFVLSGVILAFTSTSRFIVRQEDIYIAGLPAGLDGFRIANLGDVHIGRFIDARELLRGIEAINERHVDLIAVTGDLVDDVDQLEDAMQVLERTNASDNIVAILGNHEEMGDLARILSIYRQHQARIDLLVNQNIAITRGGATLHIVGVNYPLGGTGGHMLRYDEQNAAMSLQADEAFRGLASSDTVVALTHHPAFFPFASAHGAQLTLASHTHGGQLRLFGHPIFDVFPYLQGIYRRGETYLDVSAGFGHWLPIRFGVPREIVIVTLRRPQSVRLFSHPANLAAFAPMICAANRSISSA